jgi:4-carboxymuconolactone decarboxylase
MASNTTPRIPPLPPEDWDEGAKDVFGFMVGREDWETGSGSYLLRTLANHPQTGLAYLTLGRQLLERSRLPDRARELLTLRIAILCDTPYEWVNHVLPARLAGLSDEEIEAIRTGAAHPIWGDLDRAILTAIDQLFGRHQIDDATWGALAGAYDRQQLIDLVFTIGHYAMTSWAINVFGIQLDDAREAMVDHFLARRDADRAARGLAR